VSRHDDEHEDVFALVGAGEEIDSQQNSGASRMPPADVTCDA
jgi:hypothetical protein